MAAKTALYILGGLLIIPGLFQFISIIQLQDSRNTFLGGIVDVMIKQKIEFGTMLLLVGGVLVFCGSRIKSRVQNENE